MLIELASNTHINFNLINLDNKVLLKYAKTQLITKGILQQSENPSYCYLKISDDFIYQLYPMLEETKLHIPNYFNFVGAVGAHISVIYPAEFEPDLSITELGDHFSFIPDSLYCIEVFNKKMVILTIQCPELELLRRKYGFPAKLNYRGLMVPFHITIATGQL